MNKFKNISVLVIIILITFLLSGCWDRRDFEKFILIKGVAVDKAKEDDRVKYTVQIVVPSLGGGGTKQGDISTYTTSATGYSLYDANRNLVKEVGKKPFYGHSEVIIISEEIAKEGIGRYLDYFIRDPEIRGRSSLVISKGEAEEVLKTKHRVENVSATGIKTMVDGVSISGAIITVDLIHFLRQLFNDTTCAVATAIEVRKEESSSSNQGYGEEKQGEEADNKKLYAEGGFFFKKDKAVGLFTRKEARGLNWIIHPEEIRGPILVKPTGESKERKIAIEILRVDNKLKPEYKDGKFRMGIFVETEGLIIEDMSRHYNITEVANIKQLNRRYATVVNNEIINTLKKTQPVGADVFGFGEAFYRKFPKEFLKIKKDWPEYYKNLPVDIDIRAAIRREGMIKEGVDFHVH